MHVTKAYKLVFYLQISILLIHLYLFLMTFWCICGPFQFDFVFSACLHMLTILKYMYAKVVTLNPMSNFTSSCVAFIVWHTCQYLQANCLIMQIEMQMLLILFKFLVYEKWILLLLI